MNEGENEAIEVITPVARVITDTGIVEASLNSARFFTDPLDGSRVLELRGSAPAMAWCPQAIHQGTRVAVNLRSGTGISMREWELDLRPRSLTPPRADGLVVMVFLVATQNERLS